MLLPLSFEVLPLGRERKTQGSLSAGIIFLPQFLFVCNTLILADRLVPLNFFTSIADNGCLISIVFFSESFSMTSITSSKTQLWLLHSTQNATGLNSINHQFLGHFVTALCTFKGEGAHIILYNLNSTLESKFPIILCMKQDLYAVGVLTFFTQILKFYAIFLPPAWDNQLTYIPLNVISVLKIIPSTCVTYPYVEPPKPHLQVFIKYLLNPMKLMEILS